MLKITAPAVPGPAADADEVAAYGIALRRLAAATALPALPADLHRRPYFATNRRVPAQAPAPAAVPAPVPPLAAVLLALAGRCCVTGVGWGGCGWYR